MKRGKKHANLLPTVAIRWCFFQDPKKFFMINKKAEIFLYRVFPLALNRCQTSRGKIRCHSFHTNLRIRENSSKNAQKSKFN